MLLARPLCQARLDQRETDFMNQEKIQEHFFIVSGSVLFRVST